MKIVVGQLKIVQIFKASRRFALLSAVVFLSFQNITFAVSEYSPQAYIKQGILFYDDNANNDCQINSTVASNNNVYVIGDSYSRGVEQHGLKNKLEDSGFKVIGYNDNPGRSITGVGNESEKGSAIDAIKQDQNAIKQAGTIIIVLGTNQPSTYDSQIPEFMKELNSINNGARKLWVNAGNVEQLEKDIKTANDAINKHSIEFNYSVVDWYSQFIANKDSYGSNLHPSPSGYDALTKLIIDSIGQSQSTTNATTQLPTVDPNKDMGEENAPYVWAYFIGKGLTPIQVAGLMGNLQAEGHFEPRIVEYGKLNSSGEKSEKDKPSSLDNSVPVKTPGGEDIVGGYGLAQWTSMIKEDGSFTIGRKQGLIDLLKERQKQDPSLTAGNLNLQLDYIWYELNETWRIKALDGLRAAGDNLKEATKSILYDFEAPKNYNTDPSILEDRVKLAENLLAKHAGISGITSGCNKSGIAGGYGWDLDGTNSMVYYAQTDKKWADKPFGIGPIWECACGPTSMAMITATLNGDSSITPPEVAKYYYEHGGQVGYDPSDGKIHCGSNWNWQVLADEYGLKMENIGVDFNKASETLKSGGLILVSVGVGTFTSGGHLMVIRKVSEDGNSFYLADPYSDKGQTHGESNKKAYTIDELRSDGSLRNMWSFTK